MIDDQELREMLRRRANTVPATSVDTPKVVRRARRRLFLNGAVAAVAAAVIAVTTFARIDAIRNVPIPADRPAPTPAPGVLRANGEVLSFTGDFSVPGEAIGDLVAVTPGTGEERVLAEDLADARNARWSADGRWVAFETPSDLWVVDRTGEPR
jgi:hypothetical protein